jgi:Phage protein Gp138 N-terminal domain
MDRRERASNPTADIRAAHAGFQSTLWTALPAIVQSYDAAALTVEAQPTIQFQSLGPTGVWTTQNMPLCVDCPVVIPWAGGFGLTLPIASGDEGLLVFASRCIDSWWAQGGVQGQAELRMHDLSDGFFVPGCFSQPNVLPNASTTKPQLRNKAGTLLVELDPATSQCNVLAAGGLWVNGVRVTVP